MSLFISGENRGAKAAALGVVTAVAAILVMLCVISAAVMFMPSIPYDLLGYISLAAFAVGSFVGGYVAAAVSGSKGLMLGLICAGAVFLLTLAAGFVADGGTLTVMTPLRAAVLAVFGAFGGVKGVNRRERVRIR